MNKSAYIIIGIIIVLIAGILVFNNEPNVPVVDENENPITGQMPANENSDVNEMIVENTIVEVAYTNEGFSPSNISVPQGSTVVFKNESTRNMWVASSPHPTHTDFPEFDSKKSVAPGGTYEFTFSKSGNWKYHNHLFPEARGAVVVE